MQERLCEGGRQGEGFKRGLRKVRNKCCVKKAFKNTFSSQGCEDLLFNARPSRDRLRPRRDARFAVSSTRSPLAPLRRPLLRAGGGLGGAIGCRSERDRVGVQSGQGISHKKNPLYFKSIRVCLIIELSLLGPLPLLGVALRLPVGRVQEEERAGHQVEIHADSPNVK